MISTSKYADDVSVKNYYRKEPSKIERDTAPKRVTFLNFGPPGKEEDDYKKISAEKNPTIISDSKLLPILDYKYNLREIVKQCILLEDHLIQKEKQCHDCIIKHFLAMEALSEESLTLHKDLTPESSLTMLPTKIREIQRHWYSNPDQNSISSAQQLRKLRKEYMENSFAVIFDPSNEGSCSSSKCRIR